MLSPNELWVSRSQCRFFFFQSRNRCSSRHYTTHRKSHSEDVHDWYLTAQRTGSIFTTTLPLSPRNHTLQEKGITRHHISNAASLKLQLLDAVLLKGITRHYTSNAARLMLQPLGADLLIRSDMPDSALFAPLPLNHATKPSVLATAQSKPWQTMARHCS